MNPPLSRREIDDLTIHDLEGFRTKIAHFYYRGIKHGFVIRDKAQPSGEIRKIKPLGCRHDDCISYHADEILRAFSLRLNNSQRPPLVFHGEPRLWAYIRKAVYFQFKRANCSHISHQRGIGNGLEDALNDIPSIDSVEDDYSNNLMEQMRSYIFNHKNDTNISCIYYHIFEEMSYYEISEMLGISPNNVSQRILRAMKQLTAYFSSKD